MIGMSIVLSSRWTGQQQGLAIGRSVAVPAIISADGDAVAAAAAATRRTVQ